MVRLELLQGSEGAGAGAGDCTQQVGVALGRGEPGREGPEGQSQSGVRAQGPSCISPQSVPTHGCERRGRAGDGERRGASSGGVSQPGHRLHFVRGCLFKENHYVYSKLWAAALRGGIISESWAINQLWGLATDLLPFRRVGGTEELGREQEGLTQAQASVGMTLIPGAGRVLGKWP